VNTTSVSIPGFQGYAARESRAESERVFRAHLGKELTSQQERLGEVEIDLLTREDGRSAEVDRVVRELQIVIDDLTILEPGDATWLNRPKLREEDLELLQGIDLALLRLADQALRKTDEIVATYRDKRSLAAPIGDLIYILLGIAAKLNQRVDIIRTPLP
jgi:hypothetical protein